MDEILYYILNYWKYLIYLIGALLIIKMLFSQLLKRHHSNWNTLIDNFEFSTIEFYEQFKKEIESNGIANITMGKITLKEGGMFSKRRMYFRVRWKEYQYDICAAPFGKGFFISWWLLYENSLGQILLSKIPFIGSWLVYQWYPITYYKADTASMFMTYAQSAVLKVIDDITNNKGVRVLTEQERKPILNNIFKR